MSLDLVKPAIYLITKGEATPANFDQASREILDIIRMAVGENVSIIQIREKNLTARQVFELTVKAVRITRGTATHLLVNDRADIALAANADGVHLAAKSLPVNIIRGNFPKNIIVVASTHSVDAATRAVEQSADLIVFGPVFETPGKGSPVGLAALSAVCEKLRPFPVIGLGGIDETNYASVLEAGASGVAAIRSLNDPENLRLISRAIRK